MLKQERQNIILQQLNLHNRVQSAELCSRLKVSEDTVRRDLQELADDGRLMKVHGGAVSAAFHSTLRQTSVYSESEKQIIAGKAVQMLSDGMVVLMSGGTTMRALIQMIPATLRATFITPSIPVAMQLMEHAHTEVIFIGNRLNRESQMSVGAEVIRQLNTIKADILFLGTNAVDSRTGISDSDWDVVQVKRSMIQASRKIVALSISEKLNTAQSYQVCKPKDIDVLITELKPAARQLQSFRNAGIEVV